MSPLLIVKILVVVVLILAIPAAFFGYQAHTNSTSYLLARGNEAIERLDLKENVKEVERIQKLLEKKGDMQAAYLIHGKSLVYAGEASLKQTPAPPPYKEMQQAAQMIIGSSGLSEQAAATRPVHWVFASFYQKPPRSTSPALNAFRAALAELAKIQDDGPIGAEGTVLAAECLLYIDEKRLAEEGLRVLIKRHPDNLEAHRLLSVIYIDLNSPGGAIKHLEEWTRLEPSNGLPYRWIGFFQKDNNEQGPAIKAYQEALKRNLKPEARAETIKELTEIYLLSEGNPAQALETLALGTPEFQSDPDVLALRVECLVSMGKDAEALKLVEQALRDNPKNTKILVLRAQIYINENKPELALPLLEKAVELDPYDLRAQTQLMNIYAQLGKKELADKQRAQVEEVTKIQTTWAALRSKANTLPWDADVRYELGALCVKINRPDDARTWLQAALACNPAHAKARRLLSKIPPKEKVLTASKPAVGKK
jgi:tetratricopeptide (TPR) repeat protein